MLTALPVNAAWVDLAQKDLVVDWSIKANESSCMVSPVSVDFGSIKVDTWATVDTTITVECTGPLANFNMGLSAPAAGGIMNYKTIFGKQASGFPYNTSSGYIYVGMAPKTDELYYMNDGSQASLVMNANGTVKYSYIHEEGFTGKKTYNLEVYAYIPAGTNDFTQSKAYNVDIPITLNTFL